jgi:hypothetical protein
MFHINPRHEYVLLLKEENKPTYKRIFSNPFFFYIANKIMRTLPFCYFTLYCMFHINPRHEYVLLLKEENKPTYKRIFSNPFCFYIANKIMRTLPFCFSIVNEITRTLGCCNSPRLNPNCKCKCKYTYRLVRQYICARVPLYICILRPE